MLFLSESEAKSWLGFRPTLIHFDPLGNVEECSSPVVMRINKYPRTCELTPQEMSSHWIRFPLHLDCRQQVPNINKHVNKLSYQQPHCHAQNILRLSRKGSSTAVWCVTVFVWKRGIPPKNGGFWSLKLSCLGYWLVCITIVKHTKPVHLYHNCDPYAASQHAAFSKSDSAPGTFFLKSVHWQLTWPILENLIKSPFEHQKK